MLKVAITMLLFCCALIAQPSPPVVILPGSPPGGAGAACADSTNVGYLAAAGLLYTCQGSPGSRTWIAGGGGGAPGAPAGSVQMNVGGALAGTAAVATTGPELITNGGFVGGTTGWTLGADITYGSNDVICVFATNCNVSQNVVLVSGQWYRVKWTMSQAATEFSFTQFGFTNDAYGSDAYSNGVWTALFQANFTGTDTIIFSDLSGNFYGGVDGWHLTGISVRQVASPVNPSLFGTTADPQLTLDDANFNTGLGLQALKNVTPNFVAFTGLWNTAVGAFSGNAITAGAFNTAIGLESLARNTTGNENVALGANALGWGAAPAFDTAVGTESLQHDTSGIENTAVGHSALNFLTTGNQNTAVGRLALDSEITGSNNVALGFRAGSYETASNAFYVDDRDRGNTANDKADALLYGNFAAAPANQALRVNAALTTAGPGHISIIGTAPTLTAGCNGAGSSVAANSTDSAGTFTTQTAAATTCTLSFNVGFAVAPTCVFVDANASTTPVAYSAGAMGTGTAVVDFASASSKTISYICMGH